MTALESLYGTIFSDKTLKSLPVGYGAKECWDNIDQDNLLDFGDNSKNLEHISNIVCSLISCIPVWFDAWKEMWESESGAISKNNVDSAQVVFQPGEMTDGNVSEPEDVCDMSGIVADDSSENREDGCTTGTDEFLTLLQKEYWEDTLKGLLEIQAEEDSTAENCGLINQAAKDILKVVECEKLLFFKKLESDQVPMYWDEIMTDTQSDIVMEHYLALEDWELNCMLLSKNDSGQLIDMVTGQCVGVKLIDITYCEGFRNLKLLTDASLISVYPTLDKPWTHPLKNQKSKLDITNDTKLHGVIGIGHSKFCDNAGYSMEWDGIKKWPPDVFLVDFEKRKKVDPSYTEVERIPLHRVRATKRGRSRVTKKNGSVGKVLPNKRRRGAQKPVKGVRSSRKRLPFTKQTSDEESSSGDIVCSDSSDNGDSDGGDSISDRGSDDEKQDSTNIWMNIDNSGYQLRSVINRPLRYKS
jgi:hypothetical protein